VSLIVAGSVAGVAAAPATESSRLLTRAYCDNITQDEINRLLKALEAENAARQKAVAAANAKKKDAAAQKAAADADTRRAATVMVNDMAKTGECKDGFVEKDPRSKEIQRLYDLASAASEKGSEKLSEQYSEKASKIQEALDIDADRACGGKGASFLDTCRKEAAARNPRSAERDQLQRKADEAAKKGDTAAADRYSEQAKQLTGEIEAGTAMECVVKMTQLQIGAGGVAAHEASTAASQASNDASRLMHEAQESGAAEGAAAGDFTESEYARLKECILGRINLPDGTPMDAQSAAVIDRNASQLKAALGIK
jgi:hypothetical protein